MVTMGLLGGLSYAAWDYYRVSQIFYPPDYRATAYREHTLEKIQGTWLFRDEARFAEFTITPLTADNAARLYTMGEQVLHFSPEAQVVEKLITSAELLGHVQDANFYEARYRAAFPKEYARWLVVRGSGLKAAD